jgi:hypothetical protein
VKEAVVIFNNTVGARAAANARRLMEVLRDSGPAMSVIAAPEPPREQTLFDDV